MAFGLFMGLMNLAFKGAGMIYEHKENEKCKKNYRNSNGYTYIDYRGKTRLLSNNHIAMYTTAVSDGVYGYRNIKKGDFILIDIDDGLSLVMNFDIEKRKKEKKIKLDDNIKSSNGHSTYFTHAYNWYTDKGLPEFKDYPGTHFIDRKTKEVYVIREVDGFYCYISTITGLIVRKTDYQMQKEKENNNIYKYMSLDIDLNNKIAKDFIASVGIKDFFGMNRPRPNGMEKYM